MNALKWNSIDFVERALTLVAKHVDRKTSSLLFLHNTKEGIANFDFAAMNGKYPGMTEFLLKTIINFLPEIVRYEQLKSSTLFINMFIQVIRALPQLRNKEDISIFSKF